MRLEYIIFYLAIAGVVVAIGSGLVYGALDWKGDPVDTLSNLLADGTRALLDWVGWSEEKRSSRGKPDSVFNATIYLGPALRQATSGLPAPFGAYLASLRAEVTDARSLPTGAGLIVRVADHPNS